MTVGYRNKLYISNYSINTKITKEKLKQYLRFLY